MPITDQESLPKDIRDAQQPPEESPSSVPASIEAHGSSDVFDDIWGEESPPHGTAAGSDAIGTTSAHATTTSTPDLNRLRRTHVTAGYREGVAAARESAVQDGFDEGYLLGAAIGIRAGYLHGLVEGLEHGLDLGALDDAAARAAVEQPLRLAKQELSLASLLSEQYISTSGTWKWEVESSDGDVEQEDMIGTVADAHPVLRKWNRIMAIYAQQLGLRRRESN